jgi:lipopolysaccharide biosynthesis regulator YciM
MSGIYSFVLWGGVLALTGWAAWTLSGGFTTARPGPDTPYQHGLDALLRGDADEALRAFTETVEIDTDNVDAYIHIGNLLRERGEAARALHVHRELTVRAGQTPAQQRGTREALVLDLIALGRFEEAVDWDRAFDVRSELARMNGERENGALARYRSAAGESFLRAGKTRDAERQFKSALRLDKDHPAALLRLGDICYRGDRRERAVVLWKGLALTHPDLAHLVLERLETAYFEGGRFSDMSQAYEEILARTPKDARIHLALARMHIKKGDLAEACGVLGQALAIEPGSLSARLLLVNVYRRLGDLSKALDEMETLLRGTPKAESFTCVSCGAASEEYWTRCPHCLAWSAA